MSQNGEQTTDPAPDKSDLDIAIGENVGSTDGDVHEQLVESFIPDGDQYLEKSYLAPEQAPLFASWFVLSEVDDDLTDDTQKLMRKWASWVLQGQISIHGRGREDTIRGFETLGSSASPGHVVVGGPELGEEAEEDDDDGGILGLL